MLEQVHVKNFVGEHVNLFLLQVRQLGIYVHHVLILHSLSNDVPFLFELEALVVVLDTPLLFVGCKLIRICLSGLLGLGGSLGEKGSLGGSQTVKRGDSHSVRHSVALRHSGS
jgi:hypothetical protein